MVSNQNATDYANVKEINHIKNNTQKNLIPCQNNASFTILSKITIKKTIIISKIACLFKVTDNLAVPFLAICQ